MPLRRPDEHRLALPAPLLRDHLELNGIDVARRGAADDVLRGGAVRLAHRRRARERGDVVRQLNPREGLRAFLVRVPSAVKHRLRADEDDDAAEATVAAHRL